MIGTLGSIFIIIFVGYLFPLMLCHIFSWIGNKFVLYEEHLIDSECMFLVGFIPLLNYLMAVLQICGYIVHLFVTIYRKTGLNKTKFSFDKLYEKYYDFIMGNK